MIVGVSGATRIVYAVRMLELLRAAEVESHLVITRAGDITRSQETDLSAAGLRALADVAYPVGDVGAVLVSGSFRAMGMVVVPCSVRTMSEIAYSVTSNLLTRAADVVLKERRRLVLMLCETPLSLSHCRAAVAVTENGGIVAPPVPAFYLRPRSLEEMVDHTPRLRSGSLPETPQ